MWETAALIMLSADTNDFNYNEIRPIPYLRDIPNWDRKIPKQKAREYDLGMSKQKEGYCYTNGVWKLCGK